MDSQDPTDLEAAQAQREESEKERTKQREVEVADFKWLMSEPRGRRFVWRLMREGGVFHSTFSGNALEMARNEGRREQGLALVNEVLAVCPEQWLNMIKDQPTR